MGLAAAVATFRGEIPIREKLAWIALITILMVTEVINLYVADADQLDRFKKISDALALTRDGLDRTAAKLDFATANSQAYFQQSKGQIAAVTKTLAILREEDKRRTEQMQQLQLSNMSAEQLGNSAREIARQMKTYWESYSYNDSEISLIYWDRLEGTGAQWTQQQRDDWMAEERRKRLELQKSYEAQALNLIADANRIRGES